MYDLNKNNDKNSRIHNSDEGATIQDDPNAVAYVGGDDLMEGDELNFEAPKNQAQVLKAIDDNEREFPERGLPEDVEYLLQKNKIYEVPLATIETYYSSNQEDGEAFAFVFSDQLIIMWRKTGSIYTYVNFTEDEILDIIADQDQDLTALAIVTQFRTFNTWIDTERISEIENFVNCWNNRADLAAAAAPPKPVAEESPVAEETAEEDFSDKELSDMEIVHNQPIEKKPQTVLFGSFLVYLIAGDEGNITVDEHKVLDNLIGNPSLFSLCIDCWEAHSLEEHIDQLKNRFSLEQKGMVIANMLDLAYRNGDPEEDEMATIQKIVVDSEFPIEEYNVISNVFALKNNFEILGN